MSRTNGARFHNNSVSRAFPSRGSDGEQGVRQSVRDFIMLPSSRFKVVGLFSLEIVSSPRLFFSLFVVNLQIDANKQTGKIGPGNDPASSPPSFCMIVLPRAVFPCYNRFKALDLLLLTKRKRLCCRFFILFTSLHFFLAFYVIYPGGVTLPLPYSLAIFLRDHVGIVLRELSSNQRQSL